MGAGSHGGFGNSLGSRKNGRMKTNLQFFASKVFGVGGLITEEAFAKHGAFFLGKSAKRIVKEMQQQGYEIHIERSTHKTSKARKVVVDNPSKIKNVTSVQISPGSKRHGETAYVKVSTSDVGKLKIVADKKKYKSDGKETAKLYFVERRIK